MSVCINLLLIFFVSVAHDVFAKPGFDDPPALTLNSIRYEHERHREYHIKNGVEFVKKQQLKTSSLNTNIAKNTILFLGDGLSLPILSATRVYNGGEEKSLSFEDFPFVAMSKTYCVDQQVADSACTATGNYRFCPIIYRKSWHLIQNQIKAVKSVNAKHLPIYLQLI